MQISGIKKTTLLDYPGKVATLIFTPGCNIRCRYCHNPEFVLPSLVKQKIPFLIKEEAFFNFLEKRKDFLDGVVICGGEPTIQGDLKEFAKKIKEKGLLVKLDTNGTNPKILKELIDEKIVDYVAMDIKSDLKNYESLVGKVVLDNILESISLLKEGRVDYEFRTTVIKGHHSKETLENLLKEISGAKKYFIQNFRKGVLLDENFDGESFKSQELEDIKLLAEKYVETVKIRN